MKRRCLGIVIAVVVGAVLTLASAWGPMFVLTEVSPVPQAARAWRVDDQRVGVVLERSFDWWLPVDEQTSYIREGKLALRAEEGFDPEHFGGPTVYFTGWDSWALPIDETDAHKGSPAWRERYTQAPGGELVQSIVRTASGWPLRAMEAYQIYLRRSADQPGLYGVDKGLMIVRGEWMLPVKPIWSGLILDAALWSAATGVLWIGVARCARGVVGWRRTRHGGCRRCGYSRAGLVVGAPCPECGAV